MDGSKALTILTAYVGRTLAYHDARAALLYAPTTEEVVEGVLDDLRDHKTTLDRGVARLFKKADDAG